MRISQKLEYACRAMAQLAKHPAGETLTRLDALAQREAVSANFLVQILNDLKRTGLVESKRGKTGGYTLGKPAKEITLFDITTAVEPSMLSHSLTKDGESGPAVEKAWLGLSTQLTESLKKVSLSDLASSDESTMFYI